MKIYKSNYRDHWISPHTIVEYMFFWTAWSKCGRARGIVEDGDYVDAPAWANTLADIISPVSHVYQWIGKKVWPQISYVKIDSYDTWSMDHTLADIILPMLRQLDETKHGAPFTDDSDVPEYLQSHMAQPKENEWGTDSLHFMRWNWILSEMIWAFEQKVSDDAEGQFFDHSAYDPGSKGTNEWLDDLTRAASRVKYDQEGHAVWQARKANGFRLFGKYLEALWD
jgi:hypothetical protein